jgi:hypothetical protein
MRRISISICPTALEFASGDMYDGDKVLDAIREFAAEHFPDGAAFSTLQIGHRQGDAWAKVDGSLEDGGDFMEAFWRGRAADASLFVNP